MVGERFWDLQGHQGGLAWLFLLLCALASPAASQPLPQWPDSGDQLLRSRSLPFLTEDPCILSFSRGNRRFFCSGARLVSISRSAEMFNLGPGPAPTLSCTVEPCVLLFPSSGDTTAGMDWIMPSAALTGTSLLLTWQAPSAGVQVVWEFDYCTYRAGDPPCVPAIGMHLVVSAAPAANVRTDVLIDPFTPPWNPSDHVVFRVIRRKSDGQDTLIGNAAMDGLRLELAQ